MCPDLADQDSEVTVATAAMCAEAFDTLVQHLQPSERRRRASTDALPTTRCGLFVTWSKRRGSGTQGVESQDEESDAYALRGCIGTLQKTTLASGLSQYALHAAVHDGRFAPIAEDELRGLKVGVSLLSKFERARHAYDWRVGTHGIVLDLDQGRRSATYLPDVCSENGWSRTRCVQSLAEKAGFAGELCGVTLEQAVVTRYQASKAEMRYDQYLALLEL